MKLIIVILIISIIGNLFGLFVVYKLMQKSKLMVELQDQLARKNRLIDELGKNLPRRMVFIHHSVGRNWLNEGGLKDSLLSLGIGITGATYGDNIGEKTDICHWAGKFQKDMQRIFRFKSHPDSYYTGDRENDIIMFKSCFPNSNIVSDGDSPDDTQINKKTATNYKATFKNLKVEFSKYPGKIFIYVTAPPLVPSKTTTENANRAGQFNNWLISEFLPKYKEETGLENLIIFDLFKILVDDDNYLKKEYRRAEHDSHPNVLGSKAATGEFLKFLKNHNVI